MKKYSLQSGKIVEISLVNTETALNLFRAVLNECKNANIDISNLADKTLADVLKDNIQAVINIFASEDVFEAIKICCARVTYNKQKFSMDIFEDEKFKGDLIPLMQLVAIENLAPFFPKLRIVLDVIEQSILM